MTVYSHSRLSCYEQCPAKFKLQYIDKVETEVAESVEAFLGRRVHETLEKLYRDLGYQKMNSLEDLLGFLRSEWKKNWSEDIVIVKDEYTQDNYLKMGGSFSATIDSLTSNTTYYYKAVAENDADTWSGLILSVIPGQPVVVTRQPGEIGKNHAILKGELWHTGGTTECDVWFVYSDVGPNQFDQSTTPQTMNATGSFQAYIGNLSSTTKYWYRAIADNGVAQGKGDIYEFTTIPTSEIRTSGVLGKPYKPHINTVDEDFLSRVPAHYIPLLEKHPMLLKLLQQPRFRALLDELQ